MTIRRTYTTSRTSGKLGAAGETMKLEMMKKGKLPAGERYKRLMKKKLAEHQKQAQSQKKSLFSLPGAKPVMQKTSKHAEQVMRQMAERKARKEAKAERMRVIVTPRTYYNGSVNKKGEIYDVAGNRVAQINLKNGRMATAWGTPIGKYKPGSYFTDVNIQNSINMYSPYFIKQRQMAMMQQQGMEIANVHGPMRQEQVLLINTPGGYEEDHSNPNAPLAGMNSIRQNVSGTAWGAMSDNVHGTFGDNAWGTMSDNVWGTVSTNVWGGIGDSGSLWSWRGMHVWGTGNGKNYIKGITNFLASLFGLGSKRNRERLAAFRAASGRSGGGGSGGGAARPTARSR